MTLHEIFYSIQGEGGKAGDAAIFIRFAGCNLECPWCDTDHSEVMSYTPLEVMERVKQYPEDAMVVLTGGEPMMQNRKEMLHLLDLLVFNQKFIAMETNGIIYDQEVTADLDWTTISPKLGTRLGVPFEDICELKFVMVPQLTLKDIPKFKGLIYLQPLSMDEKSTLRCVDWVQKFPNRFRLSVQLQKYLNLR